MSSSLQKQRRRAPWENNERHYCALCNAWMGSDRQSILIHENGKKHREKVEEDLQRRRLEKVQKEKDEARQAEALRRIEAAAASAHAADVGSGGAFCRPAPTPAAAPAPYYPAVAPTAYSSAVPSSTAAVPPPPGPAAPPPPAPAAPAPKPAGGGGAEKKSEPSSASRSELDAWLARKKKREDARLGGDDPQQSQGGGGADASASRPEKRRKIELGENEGHYSIGDVTYLEGPVYASVLSEEVPAQIWTGPGAASDAEKRSVHQQRHWKTGLVVKVRREEGGGGSDDNDAEPERVTCDIAYLRDPSDDDETLEKSVRPDRVRIVLGSDDALPGTVEEARLELMGGEEIVQPPGGGGDGAAEIDENTGLSSWGTVSVRRVTVGRDVKEERARLRAKWREEAEREREKEREAAGRRMEEARHANADDSALGSYDVWSGGKGGYKGVNIHAESKVDVADTAKSLAKGKGVVQFKKKVGKASMFKKAKKKQNRRVTSADDED